MAVAVLPVAAVGWLVLVRQTWRAGDSTARVRLALSPLAGLGPRARLRGLPTGGPRLVLPGLLAVQGDRIAYQAGAEEGATRVAVLVDQVADRLHALAQYTSTPAEVLLRLIVVAPASVLALGLATRGRSTDRDVRRAVFVGTHFVLLALLYAGWWLAVTPEEKLWLRRVVIGLFALGLATVVAAATLPVLRDRPLPGVKGVALWVTTLVALAGVGVVYAAGDSRREQDLKTLVARVREGDARGERFYGIGFWSAPAVSLYADLPFGDAAQADLCAPGARASTWAGRSYVVWDFYAEATGDPETEGLVLSPVGTPTNAGRLWQMALADGRCE